MSSSSNSSSVLQAKSISAFKASILDDNLECKDTFSLKFIASVILIALDSILSKRSSVIGITNESSPLSIEEFVEEFAEDCADIFLDDFRLLIYLIYRKYYSIY